MLRCARRLFVLVAGAAFCTGCSVSLPMRSQRHEVVVGYVAQDRHRQLLRRIAPGLDLRVGGRWPGLSLGYAEQTMLEPSAAAPAPPDASDTTGPGFAWPLGITWRAADGVDRWLGWVSVDAPDRAVTGFVADTYLGISLLTAPAPAGLRIGIGRTTVLVAPAEGAQAIAFCSHDPEGATFTDMEEEE